MDDPWIPLGVAAIAAIDTCARAFASDQRELPPDHADARLWGENAGRNTTQDDAWEEIERREIGDEKPWRDGNKPTSW